MKTPLLKYLVMTVLCSMSSYSYWYLNARSADLQAIQHQSVALQQVDQATTNVPFVQPPTSKEDPKKKPYDQEKDRNLLPDVEFLKFIIDKGKEGIPVLNLPKFFRSETSLSNELFSLVVSLGVVSVP